MERALLWLGDQGGADRVSHVWVSTDASEVAYDFDRAGAWVPGAPVDCPFLLHHWNLWIDFAASVPSLAEDFLARDRLARAAYDKLFWGCNLPAMTPPGRRYTPRWRRRELGDLEGILAAGIALVRAALEASHPATPEEEVPAHGPRG